VSAAKLSKTIDRLAVRSALVTSYDGTLSSADQAAATQREAEAELVGLAKHPEALAITDEDSKGEVVEFMREWQRRGDAVELMRTSATKPLLDVKRTIDGWFKPANDAISTIVEICKKAIGAYDLAQDNKRLAAKAEAQAAAEAHDTGAMLTALTVAASSAPAKVKGSSTRFEWRVKRIIREMLPAEWLVPDEVRIAKHARDAGTSETGPDPIPGVVFERVPFVTGRR
jgi:hypothetical protein